MKIQKQANGAKDGQSSQVWLNWCVFGCPSNMGFLALFSAPDCLIGVFARLKGCQLAKQIHGRGQLPPLLPQPTRRQTPTTARQEPVTLSHWDRRNQRGSAGCLPLQFSLWSEIIQNEKKKKGSKMKKKKNPK